MSAARQPGADAVPALARGVRLREDRTRGAYVLLAPERVVQLDEQAYAVVALIDGRRDLAAIAAALALQYSTGAGEILPDVCELAASLQTRGLLQWSALP